MVKRTYKYRLSTNREQAKLLTWQLARCRELYNAAIQQRRDAWRMRKHAVSYYEQQNELPAIKEVRPEYADIHSQVLQDVLRRVDKAYKAFYRRVKQAQTPGYPCFQGRGRYDSITYPQSGWAVLGSKLTLSKIGTLKVKFHRELLGKVKTVTIKREGQHWYVCFSVEIEVAALPQSDAAVGVDMGLNYFATLSNGEQFSNPRYLRGQLAKLALKQQALARCKRGSHRHNRAKQAVASVHRKVANQRKDFAHKLSCQLVNRYGTIVFEDLQPQNMVKNHHLALSISDVGWSQFQQYCSYKAESAGRTILFVNPAYTSQQCSGCGVIVKKELDERWHCCPCGVELDRDMNAVINILRLGSSQRNEPSFKRRSPRL